MAWTDVLFRHIGIQGKFSVLSTLSASSRVFLLAAALLLAALPVPAYAQTVSGPADLGQIEKGLEKPKLKLPREVPKAERPVSPIPALEAPKGADKIHFVLKGVDFEDGTVFSREELDGFTASRVGKDVTLADVYRLAAEVTAKYRDGGWILSRAVIPPQDIKTGRVKIKLVEGYIAFVRTEGSFPPSRIVTAIIEKLSDKKPFNIKRLEKSLLLMNDLSGLNVKAVLEPLKGEKVSVSKGIGLALLFSHQDKTEGSVSFDNYGSKYVGPYHVSADANRSGFFTPYSLTSIRGSVATQTDELRSLSFSHQIPLMPGGLSLTGFASYSASLPGFTLKTTQTDSKSFTLLARLKQPLIRSREQNLFLGAEFGAKNVGTDVLGVELYDDRLRIGRVDLSYDLLDSGGGSNSLKLSDSRGFNIMGARKTGSANLSRALGKSDFNKMEFTAVRQQPIAENASLYTAFTSQYTHNVLLSSEQFTYGGSEMGRSYDPSEISGDSGVAGTLEVRFMGPSHPFISSQPYIFYDIGKVWDNGAGVKPLSAMAIGAGIRYTLGQSVSGVITVARPMTLRASAPDYGNGYAPSLTFSLRKQF